MNDSALPLTLVLALIWGVCVAMFLEFTKLGAWMRERLNWFVVATGSGVNLLLLLLVVEHGQVIWWHIPAVFFASSIPIAVGGVMDFHRYWQEIQNAAKEGRDEG